MEISPKYIMSLIEQIEKTIWSEFQTYKKVESYIKRWHTDNGWRNWNDYEENFAIFRKEEDKIDLNKTLDGIDGDTLIRIAIDLGIETPGFLPVLSEIKNVLKDDYRRAYESFDKAIKQIEEDPDLAIGMANSTLESIIKHILENDDIKTECRVKDTLWDLCASLLKEFQMFPNGEMLPEVKTIWSSLMSIAQVIETLRSTKTRAHGKTKKEYLVDDPMYAYFVINSISTVGLFLINFYEKKYNKKVEVQEEQRTVMDVPF